MTEPSEAAKARACELINACIGNEQFAAWKPENIADRNKVALALGRFVQQVSDAAKDACDALIEAGTLAQTRTKLAALILPDPVSPEEDAWASANACGSPREWADELRKRNLKIVEAQ